MHSFIKVRAVEYKRFRQEDHSARMIDNIEKKTYRKLKLRRSNVNEMYLKAVKVNFMLKVD